MPDLETLRRDLQRAAEQYEHARQKTQIARVEETRLLNQLNTLQADMDQAVQEIRDAAPRDSDWKRPRSANVEDTNGA